MVPPLPPNFAEPCPKLELISSDTAEANFTWALDTINKYNECSIKKDGVTNAYKSFSDALNKVNTNEK